MRQLLRELRSEHTIVLSSHILTEISETCDRILVLREGEIVAAGKEADISRHMLGGVQIEVTVRVGPAATAERVRGILAGMPGRPAVTVIAAGETGPDVSRVKVDAEWRRAGVARARCSSEGRSGRPRNRTGADASSSRSSCG